MSCGEPGKERRNSKKKFKIVKPLNRTHMRLDIEITEMGSKYRSLKRSCVKCRKEICIPPRRLCLETRSGMLVDGENEVGKYVGFYFE